MLCCALRNAQKLRFETPVDRAWSLLLPATPDGVHANGCVREGRQDIRHAFKLVEVAAAWPLSLSTAEGFASGPVSCCPLPNSVVCTGTNAGAASWPVLAEETSRSTLQLCSNCLCMQPLWHQLRSTKDPACRGRGFARCLAAVRPHCCWCYSLRRSIQS